MDILEDLQHILRRDEPLARHSWFRLGGTADYFAEPTSVTELQSLVRRCRSAEVPVRILGGGSNLLVTQGRVPGVVVHLSAPDFARVDVNPPQLTAGAGAKLGHVIATAVREGLGGLESLVGIPGTVGGALRRNAASQGSDIGQWTAEVTVITRDGDIECRSRQQLRFSSGRCNIDEMAILVAQFELEPGEPRELTRRMQKNWIFKRSKEPTGELGHGRIFADPQGMSAGELIEQAGMRNAEQGGARVDDRDCNFIVVQPGTRGEDVLALIERIREQVSHRLGVDLQPQIDIW